MVKQVYEHKNSTSSRQWVTEFGHLFVAGIFSCLCIALVGFIANYLGKPADIFTREPQTVLEGAWYVGSFSNFGGLVWFTAAAIMSFAASFNPKGRMGMIFAALVTWAMGMDDVFLFHDSLYPKFHLDDDFVYVLYFCLIALIVLRYRGQLVRATLFGIFLTVFFWMLSAVLDKFFNDMSQLAEDGAKFTGIVIWSAAWIRQAYIDILKLIREYVSHPS